MESSSKISPNDYKKVHGFPIALQHVTHLRNIDLTTYLANGTQYFSLTEVTVAFTPV